MDQNLKTRKSWDPDWKLHLRKVDNVLHDRLVRLGEPDPLMDPTSLTLHEDLGVVFPSERYLGSSSGVDIVPRIGAKEVPEKKTTYSLERFNPFHVENLLERLLRELDACSSLRNDLLNFQAEAEDRAMAFELFKELQAFDRELEEEQDKHRSYGVLGMQSELEINGEAVKPSKTSMEAAAELNSASRFLSDRRRELILAHEQRLAERREDPADGSNFAARQQRVANRYEQLLTETIAISFALSDGLNVVYGLQMQPPAYSEKYMFDYLDELVLWGRLVLRKLEAKLRSDNEHYLLIDLKYGRKQDGSYLVPEWTTIATATDGGMVGSNLVFEDQNERDMHTNLLSKSLTFHLEKNYWFANQEHIRLRGINVFVYGEKGSLNSTWRIVVRPPAYKSPFSLLSQEPQHYFPELRFSAGRRPSLETDSHIGAYFNTDPTQNDLMNEPWTLEFESAHDSMGAVFNEENLSIELVLKVATLSVHPDRRV